MNSRLFALVFFLPSIALPQAAIEATGHEYVLIRTITIAPISTSPAGLPDADQKIWAALAKIGARVETRLQPDGVVNLVTHADRAIEGVYESLGRPVRVEHEVKPIGSGHTVELRFRIVELCSCG